MLILGDQSIAIRDFHQVLLVNAYLCIIQAIDYLRIDNQLSSRTIEIHKQIKSLVPGFEEDTTNYPEIKKIKDHLYKNLISL
jgi:histidine ammonia-lyase